MIHKAPIDGIPYIAFNPPHLASTPYEIERVYGSLQDRELELFQSVCAGLPSAEDCVRKNPDEYQLPAEVFEVARTFIPQELPKPVTYYPDFWLCYQNSILYAEAIGCMYVEGVAVSPCGPMLHAWITTNGTDVYDFTWPCQHLNRYYGVAFDPKKLREAGYPYGAIFGFNKKTLAQRHIPIRVDIRTLVAT